MADPFSAVGLAGSIAGLVALSDLLFRALIRFGREVKSAKKDVESVASEIRNLSGTLHNLSLLASAFDDDQPSFRLDHVAACRQTIVQIQTHVDKALADFNGANKGKSFARRPLWPYSSKETKTLLEVVSRHKATITLALSADSMKAMLQCLSSQSDMGEALEEIKKSVKNITTRITIDKQRQQILDFFLLVNPQPNLETSVRLRHPMTGLWLTNGLGFQQWLDLPNSRLWLSGIPGAGKTVLAGSIIQESIQRATASTSQACCFFFCDYKNEKTQNVVTILGSLASQLGRQSDAAYTLIEEYYEELHPHRANPSTPEASKLQSLLESMTDTFDKVFVVVDGLDECGDDPEVVETLSSLAQNSPSISMALLSRNESHIWECLDGEYEHLDIAAQSGDIQLYVGAELEARIRRGRLRLNNMTLKDEILHRLVIGAQGMFRWVSCQLDYLCELPTDREKREALGQLPPTLTATYERILRRHTHPRSIQIIRSALNLIVNARQPLRISLLCDAVSLRDDATMIDEDDKINGEELMRLCSSLVRSSQYADYEDPPLELAHFTVQEFLQS
ncbi:uncharacterized protein BDZ99DRAFT_381646, partial [Mytilinidion resinicola]